MIRFGTLLLFSVLATSCQFFDTEKVSADYIYEEEIKTISWTDIDQYPTFEVCQSLTDKAEQESCFIEELSRHIQNSIAEKKVVSSYHLNDTVHVDFGVSNEGEIKGLAIRVDSITSRHLPYLASWLRESMETLPASDPAYKRGIPVATKFSLPIIIETTATN